MSEASTTRARIARGFWRVVNPMVRPLAGVLPWWILLETTGRKTGRKRLTPFANGPLDDGVLHLIAVHGARSAFAHNIGADPKVRIRRRGRWHKGTAEVIELDPATVQRFSRYARSGLRTFGEDARLVRIQLDL